MYAVYFPGPTRFRANFLSRQSLDNNEWSFHPFSFQEVTAWAFSPEVDLFVSWNNAKLTKFFTQIPCRQAVATDALSSAWLFWTVYASPQFFESPGP